MMIVVIVIIIIFIKHSKPFNTNYEDMTFMIFMRRTSSIYEDE